MWCVAAYLGLSVLANRTVWAHGVAHSIQASGGADVQESIWFLGQTPWAVVHGVNPFFNTWINLPAGVNLMDNTTMPLLGLAGAPITLLFGPIATFNVLVDLSFATSAIAFYFLVRPHVRWQPAAFLGGLLYGFSPFAVAAGQGHLFLLVGAFPPLLALVLDRTFRSGRLSGAGGGALFGLCLVGQFYVSTEVFASVVVMFCVSVVVAAAMRLGWGWTRLDRPPVVRFGVVAAAVCVAGLSYGAWTAVAGPQHIVGPAQTATALAGLSSDPAGTVLPTINQKFTLGLASSGDQLVAQRDAQWHVIVDDASENGDYVGIPLLLILIVAVASLRRLRLVQFCAVMAVLGYVLSFGSYLHVDGHRTGIPLPFIVLAHLPLLDSSVSARYVLFFWLFAAAIFSIFLDRLGAAWRRVAPEASIMRWVAGAVGVVALLPLLPAWPYSQKSFSVPGWFTSQARSLALGQGVLVYPSADPTNASAMVWQTAANMTFRMPGGYAVFAGPGGKASFTSPSSTTQEALALCGVGQRLPVSTATVDDDLRAWDVHQVVVVLSHVGAPCAEAIFNRALGQGTRANGVMSWPVRR